MQQPTLQVQQPMLQVQPMEVQNIIASQAGQLILQGKLVEIKFDTYTRSHIDIY